jgi:hypothetical protein
MSPKFQSANCVCPIYAASDRGRPNLIGSATLLDFGKARFLVTAAHVHDEYLENKVTLYIGASGPLLELPQPLQTTVVPSGNRDDDRLDIAFVRLPDSLADQISKGRFFLPFTLIDVNDSFRPRTQCMFTGYPASREKTNYGNRKVKPLCFSYTGQVIAPTRMPELGLYVDAHIAVEFNREKIFNQNNQPASFPSPKGMSGGAVWCGDGNSRLWLIDLPVRLVGIGIEDPKNQNTLVAVRIHLVLAAIAKFNPDINQLIPRRAGFTNEVKIVQHPGVRSR